MPAQPDSPNARVLDRIQEERARDRSIRRIAKIAWITAFVVVLLWIGITIAQIKAMMPVISMPGGSGVMVAVGLALPVILAVLGLSVLIATLSTVAAFLRMRTANFDEIQLRLASLEELLVNREATK